MLYNEEEGGDCNGDDITAEGGDCNGDDITAEGGDCNGDDITVVSVEWLDDCLTRGKLLETATYRVETP